MANQKLRKTAACLNCRAAVPIRYCSRCGQENVEPKESFGSLLGHFLGDIIHFDGKFFATASLLFKRPGFLSKEYAIGRRVRYFHPIKLYVFTSAVFFLVFFSLFIKELLPVGFKVQNGSPIEIGEEVRVFSNFTSIQQYDSLQATLPKHQKDSWMRKQLMHRTLDLSERFQQDGVTLLHEAWEKFIHNFPYLLFVSLPLYALYLKLIYRRQKQFYYADHAVFLIHLTSVCVYVFAATFLVAVVSYRFVFGFRMDGSCLQHVIYLWYYLCLFKYVALL